ncbi:UNVERIFIED_CONTAM: hypothetical protein GTU68_009952, partial [Idotea baltica]|nr:hypothetical protein [Idotea baltica]
MLGMHGNYGPNFLCNDADVVVAIGMRFDDRVTGDLKGYLKNAKIIHIEIDPVEIDKIMKVDVAINSDAKQALQALLPLITKNEHPEWHQQFKDCAKEEYEKVISKGINSTSEKIGMIEVVDSISKLTKGEAIIVADVGQHQMMSARYYQFQKYNSWVTSGGLGTMGFALPASMGCKLAAPKRTVIAIIGDGSFQMTLQELATIAQDDIEVKILILNNNYLGMMNTEIKEQKLLTFSVFTENSPGVIQRITTLFTKRNLNIESLTVSETEERGISRFTILIRLNEKLANTIVSQLKRIIEV